MNFTDSRCYDREHANSQAYIANEIVLFAFFFAIPVLLIILSYGSILSNAAASRAVQSTTASGRLLFEHFSNCLLIPMKRKEHI